VEPPVEERALAESGSGPDAEIGRRFGPTRARDQDPIAGLAIDQEQRQEVVSERLVMEARDHGAADLAFRFGGGDRGPEAQERRLAQGEVALRLNRARSGRAGQVGSAPSVV
jgi:hypothetical protein